MDEPDRSGKDTLPRCPKRRRVNAVNECYCSGGGGTAHVHCACPTCRGKVVHRVTEYRHFLLEQDYNQSLRRLRGPPSPGSDSCDADVDDVVDDREEFEHSSVRTESTGDGDAISTDDGGEESTLRYDRWVYTGFRQCKNVS